MDHPLMVLLLLWSSGLQAEGKQNSTGAQCEITAKADIMLLLDGSWSIGRVNFRHIRSFIAKVVNVFNIGPDRVQIGLTQYSGDPKTEWHLETHQTKHSLMHAIANLPYKGGNTMTGRALNHILDRNFKPNVGIRENSKRILILITDGKSQDDIEDPSQKMKNTGIEIYAIGVKNADKDQLMSIASDPIESHLFIVDDFWQLLDFVDDLTIKICESVNDLVFVRLVNGTSLCSGRLEVKSNQSDQSNQLWSSVCEADFDQQDAEVVCRDLGCGAPSVLQGALYEEVEAPTWTKEFQCSGNESALLDCTTSDSDRNTCSAGKAVELTCADPVRLVGGSRRCAGTLEVKQGGWRPVDGSDWTLTSAVAFCRKLDCVSAVSAGRREDSSNRSTWKISFDCVESGSALRECVTSKPSSSSILELTCLDPADFTTRFVIVPLILMLLITITYFILKATRGQKPGPQENIELHY